MKQKQTNSKDTQNFAGEPTRLTVIRQRLVAHMETSQQAVDEAIEWEDYDDARKDLEIAAFTLAEWDSAQLQLTAIYIEQPEQIDGIACFKDVQRLLQTMIKATDTPIPNGDTTAGFTTPVQGALMAFLQPLFRDLRINNADYVDNGIRFEHGGAKWLVESLQGHGLEITGEKDGETLRWIVANGSFSRVEAILHIAVSIQGGSKSGNLQHHHRENREPKPPIRSMTPEEQEEYDIINRLTLRHLWDLDIKHIAKKDRKDGACVSISGTNSYGDLVMRDPKGPWSYENIEAVKDIAVAEDGSMWLRIDRTRDRQTLVAMLGALGGESRSEAKAAASRANGARGGRPRKHSQSGRA